MNNKLSNWVKYLLYTAVLFSFIGLFSGLNKHFVEYRMQSYGNKIEKNQEKNDELTSKLDSEDEKYDKIKQKYDQATNLIDQGADSKDNSKRVEKLEKEIERIKAGNLLTPESEREQVAYAYGTIQRITPKNFSETFGKDKDTEYKKISDNEYLLSMPGPGISYHVLKAGGYYLFIKHNSKYKDLEKIEIAMKLSTGADGIQIRPFIEARFNALDNQED